MGRLILAGGTGKRIEYFNKAAQSNKTPLYIYSLEEYLKNRKAGDIIKIDPPPAGGTEFDVLIPFVLKYNKTLDKLSCIKEISFLNEPCDIKAALDKRETKERLKHSGIPIPPYMEKQIYEYDELLNSMAESKLNKIFIKSRYGSGAAGVIAFSHMNNREVLYTSLKETEGKIYNTKKIYKSEDRQTNKILINKVLSNDALVEKWIPKDSVNGISYDLRVVWQFGKIKYIIPRGSKGPITNLHLNDMALEDGQVNIDERLKEKILEISNKTMAQFKGLRYAGLDILIPPKDNEEERKPLIIEVNGQGDLIYKDIFLNNEIYKEQIEYMKEKMYT